MGTQVVRRYSTEGRAGVVVDALLFEAGSDKDVDRVLFVDTPRDVRSHTSSRPAS